MTGDIIAEENLVARKGEDEKTIVVRISLPSRSREGEYACQVILDGLHGRLSPIVGATALTALALAIRFVQLRLRYLEDDGWSLFLLENGKLHEWGPMYGFGSDGR